MPLISNVRRHTSIMAIWQFDLALVPRSGPLPWKTADGHEVPAIESREVVTARNWLHAHYGVPWVMLEDWFVYGAEKSNRVDLLLNQDGTAEVRARIDARSEAAVQFVGELCELSSLLECVLFSAELWKSVEATPAALSLALERSRAAAFVRDPEKVLRGAGSGA